MVWPFLSVKMRNRVTKYEFGLWLYYCVSNVLLFLYLFSTMYRCFFMATATPFSIRKCTRLAFQANTMGGSVPWTTWLFLRLCPRRRIIYLKISTKPFGGGIRILLNETIFLITALPYFQIANAKRNLPLCHFANGIFNTLYTSHLKKLLVKIVRENDCIFSPMPYRQYFCDEDYNDGGQEFVCLLMNKRSIKEGGKKERRANSTSLLSNFETGEKDEKYRLEERGKWPAKHAHTRNKWNDDTSTWLMQNWQRNNVHLVLYVFLSFSFSSHSSVG